MFASWICDGDDDCNDGFKSDEANCTSTIRPAEPTTHFPFITNVSSTTYIFGQFFFFLCPCINTCLFILKHLGYM